MWLAGQMSELNAEIGHNHASPSLQVHYLMLELFGSRYKVILPSPEYLNNVSR